MKAPLAYYKLYDEIYSRKDYAREVKIILGIFKKYFSGTPKKILDVGCGTGSHAFEFSKKGIRVLGVDTDPNMIKTARVKALGGDLPKPRFIYGEVGKIKGRNFDLAVSLFNVVNYINSAPDLLSFFKEISKRLKKGRPFIFDSWNGIAAIIDPPRFKRVNLAAGNRKIKITIKPEKLNLFRQSVSISNEVVVRDKKHVSSFKFSYDQTLWTPNQIIDFLKLAGFKVLSILPKDRPSAKADQNAWKIMFVCQKKK